MYWKKNCWSKLNFSLYLDKLCRLLRTLCGLNLWVDFLSGILDFCFRQHLSLYFAFDFAIIIRLQLFVYFSDALLSKIWFFAHSLSLSRSFLVVRPSHQIIWQLNWRTFCATWQALSGHKQAGRQAEKPAEEQRKAVLTMRTADVWYAAYTQSNKNHHEQQLIDAKLLKSSLINLPIICEHYVLITKPEQVLHTGRMRDSVVSRSFLQLAHNCCGHS